MISNRTLIQTATQSGETSSRPGRYNGMLLDHKIFSEFISIKMRIGERFPLSIALIRHLVFVSQEFDLTSSNSKQQSRNESLTSRIAARLKLAILNAELEFGEALSEDKLASAFGTSRTPVRGALTALQVQGLIEIKPQSGSFVFTPTRQNITELCEFRTMLELQAMQLSMERKRKETIASLWEANDRMERGKQSSDWLEIARADSIYHKALVQNCGNEYLLESFELVAARVDSIRTRITLALGDIRTRSMNEHTAIIAALEEDRLGKAKMILTSHIMTALSSFDMACKLGGFSSTSRVRTASYDGLDL